MVFRKLGPLTLLFYIRGLILEVRDFSCLSMHTVYTGQKDWVAVKELQSSYHNGYM